MRSLRFLQAIRHMRGRFCLALSVLFIAVCPPKAYADSYTYGTLDFTVTSGSPAPTGSFILDNTTNTFTNFTVNWDGPTFNFSALGSAIALSGYWCGQGPFFVSGTTCLGNDGTFSFANQLQSDGIPVASIVAASEAGYTDPSAFAYGSYTTTETTVPTPEPSSLALLMLGFAPFSLVVRKRMSRAA